MSYYMGDYYRGGFFGSLWKGIKGLAGGILGGGGGTQKIQFVGPTQGMMSMPGAGYGATASNIIRGGKAIISKHPVLSAAAAAGALAMAGGGAAMARRGKKGPAITALSTGGRRRHMHVTNVRALRRALRRTHGFAKLAMKVIKLEHPRRHGKFGGFKKRKRARI